MVTVSERDLLSTFDKMQVLSEGNLMTCSEGSLVSVGNGPDSVCRGCSTLLILERCHEFSQGAKRHVMAFSYFLASLRMSGFLQKKMQKKVN